MIIDKNKIFLKIIISSLLKTKFALENVNFKKLISTFVICILFLALFLRVNNIFSQKHFPVIKSNTIIYSLSSIDLNVESANDKTIFAHAIKFDAGSRSSNKLGFNNSKKASLKHLFEHYESYGVIKENPPTIFYKDDYSSLISISKFSPKNIPFVSRT